MYDEALFFECLFSILLIWGCLELIWAGSFQKPVRIVLYAVTAALAFILAGIGPIDAYTAWIWIHFTHSKSFSLNVELLLTFITLCYSLLPLFYFGFRRISQRGFPKALKICLPLSFLAVGGLIGWFFYSKASGLLLGKNDILVMLCWVGVAVFPIGAVVGILLARLWDRRWRAMYILCLTGLLICQDILPVLTAVSEGRIDPAYIGSSAYFNDMRLLSQSVLRFAVAGGAASLIGLI